MTTHRSSDQTFRISKGAQPTFFEDPAIDALYSMVVILTEEVSVLRDRLDTHEQLAAAKKPLSADSVESFVADGDVEKTRDEVRRQLVRRVMRPIKQLQYASVAKAQKQYEQDVDTLISE